MVTLLVYWLAEEYAEVLGEQAAGGRLPGWSRVREALAEAWPMVSASYLPLLVLVAARLAGASSLAAANAGLVAAIIVLTVHGWWPPGRLSCTAGSSSPPPRSHWPWAW